MKPLSHNFLPLGTRTLISLWEMIEILPKDFTEVWGQMDALLVFCAKQPRQETANPAQQEELRALFTNLWNTCKKWNLEESLFCVNEAREWLVEPARYRQWLDDPARPGAYQWPKEIPPANFNNVYQQLVLIRKKIHEELDSIRFALIKPGNVDFFEQEALFGKAFHDSASEEINSEIRSAGNSLAVGLNTAAAFHSLRAAEMGMRHLASYLEVVIDRGQINVAIKDSTWNEMIIGINRKIESERQKPKPERKIKGQFRDYENLAKHFDLLKDARNHLMHTQSNYNESEALGLLERVRNFMQGLAKMIPLQ